MDDSPGEGKWLQDSGDDCDVQVTVSILGVSDDDDGVDFEFAKAVKKIAAASAARAATEGRAAKAGRSSGMGKRPRQHPKSSRQTVSDAQLAKRKKDAKLLGQQARL